MMLALARECIDRCRALALFTEQSGSITRTFLSEPMRHVHRSVAGWMRAAGMNVTIDHAGNIRGRYEGRAVDAPVFYIGSHLDTVPHAGPFDGILGVMAGIALIEALNGRRLRFAIEVIGFSEEEGVRFGVPFIGSRAFVGECDAEFLATNDASGISVAAAIREFGLDPARIQDACVREQARGYLEIHIEQGPVLESLHLPVGVVESIAGQSRFEIAFKGRAGHAGTTPMHLRQDALAGAAEWICAVEREALSTDGLVATVGRIEAQPGATNVIPGSVKLTLDIRHGHDRVRVDSAARLLRHAREIASRRGLHLRSDVRMEQRAVAMDAALTDRLAASVDSPHRMVSGAGHDAMVVAGHMPAAMLFVRSPGGISHHPDESVQPNDVAAALSAATRFLESLELPDAVL